VGIEIASLSGIRHQESEKKTPQRKPGRFLFWVDGNSLIGREKLSVIVVALPK
jgi:hypothetical protein